MFKGEQQETGGTPALPSEAMDRHPMVLGVSPDGGCSPEQQGRPADSQGLLAPSDVDALRHKSPSVRRRDAMGLVCVDGLRLDRALRTWVVANPEEFRRVWLEVYNRIVLLPRDERGRGSMVEEADKGTARALEGRVRLNGDSGSCLRLSGAAVSRVRQSHCRGSLTAGNLELSTVSMEDVALAEGGDLGLALGLTREGLGVEASEWRVARVFSYIAVKLMNRRVEDVARVLGDLLESRVYAWAHQVDANEVDDLRYIGSRVLEGLRSALRVGEPERLTRRKLDACRSGGGRSKDRARAAMMEAVLEG